MLGSGALRFYDNIEDRLKIVRLWMHTFNYDRRIDVFTIVTNRYMCPSNFRCVTGVGRVLDGWLLSLIRQPAISNLLPSGLHDRIHRFICRFFDAPPVSKNLNAISYCRENAST